VTEGFDEMAHLSHVAALQSMPEPFWPRFERLHLIDPARFRFTAAAARRRGQQRQSVCAI
jgi:hypothetical protein